MLISLSLTKINNETNLIHVNSDLSCVSCYFSYIIELRFLIYPVFPLTFNIFLMNKVILIQLPLRRGQNEE